MLQFRFHQELFDLFNMYIISFPCSGRHWNEMVLMAYLVQRYNLDQHFYVPADMQLYETADSKWPMAFEQARSILKQLGVQHPLFSHDLTERDYQLAIKMHPEIAVEAQAMIDRERHEFLANEGPDEYVFCKMLLGSFQPIPWSDLDWDRSHYRGKKVVLRTRNIKDMMVSFYFHLTHLQKTYRSFSGSLSEFLRDDEYGARRALTFLKIWEEHFGIPDRFLHIRYEDLHSTPFESFERQLELLLEEPVNDKYLRCAIDLGSFENMRQLEEGGKIWSEDNKANKDSFKVREGKIGKYREYLSSEDIDYIDAIAEEMGNPFDVLSESVLTS